MPPALTASSLRFSELKESLFRSLREDNTLVPQTALNAGDAKEGSATSSEGTSKLEKDLGLLQRTGASKQQENGGIKVF